MLGVTLNLSTEFWREVLTAEIMELVQTLINKQNARDFPESDKTLRLSLKTLTKTFLQFLDDFKTLPEFPAIWMRLLHLLKVSLGDFFRG